VPIVCHRDSSGRQRAVRRIDFSFAKHNSIGLKSGLYVGRNQSWAPAASIACRTAGLFARLGGRLIDPITTTNVQQQRCMTTWCLSKP